MTIFRFCVILLFVKLDSINAKPVKSFYSDHTFLSNEKFSLNTHFLNTLSEKSIKSRNLLHNLKTLNIRLLEEEPIGKEIANMKFFINQSRQNQLHNTNNNNNNNGNVHDYHNNIKMETNLQTNSFQIFNSEPQSKFFHLDTQTGILRIARRIDRDQLCSQFKSCCNYNYLKQNENLLNTNQDEYYYLYKQNQFIYLNQNLNKITNNDNNNINNNFNYNSQCQLDLNIRSDNQYTNIISVHVHIEDINDNSPMWLLNGKSMKLNFHDSLYKHEIMKVYVSESSIIGDTVQLTPAIDPDFGINGITNYVLEPKIPEFMLEWTTSNTENGLISALKSNEYINSQTYSAHNRLPAGPRHELRLVVQNALDRETVPLYEFNLTAFDGGSPSRNSTIHLQVIVTDFNDNSPVFEKDSYSVELKENSRPHTPVIQVRATDLDEGPNGQIKYRLSSLTKPEFMRLFLLDPITGWLSVQWEIDYEVYKKIILTIEAIDGGSLPRASTCLVDITVLDENDHGPELHFEPSHLTNYALVPENELPGRLIAVFTAQDKDSGDNGRLICHLADMSKWQFDTFDKEKLESLLANPTETLFHLTQMHMPFSVMYKLTTASTFDREFISKITVWITCSDFGIPQRNSTGSVVVRITDMNDEKPLFSRTHYYLSINENTEIGTAIFHVNATDLDDGENAQLTYSVSGEHSDYVDIDKLTGQLCVRQKLDRETISELRLKLYVKDHGTPSLNSSADITISIQDVNDNAPDVLERMEFYVYENHTASLPIGKIIVKDLDQGRNAEVGFILTQCLAYSFGRLDYDMNDALYNHSEDISRSFSYPYNHNELKRNITKSLEVMYTFFIAKDGQIYLGRSKLDRELYSLYELNVYVEDYGQPKLRSSTKVMIHVLDVNDNVPKFIFPSIGNNTVYVSKESKPGTFIAKIYAIDDDLDENGQITYEFQNNDNLLLESLFQLDSNTGDLILKNSINFKTDLKTLKIDEEEQKINNDNNNHENNNNNYNNNNLKNETENLPVEKNKISPNSKTLDRYITPQMAYSLVITASDNGTPKLKSSTVLRILFTPPFYPPHNHNYHDQHLNKNLDEQYNILSNYYQKSNMFWKKSFQSNPGLKRTHPIINGDQDNFEESKKSQSLDQELTGIGVLLGLVTAIGLFVCFVILVIMITLHHTKKLQNQQKHLMMERQSPNPHKITTHSSMNHLVQHSNNPESLIKFHLPTRKLIEINNNSNPNSTLPTIGPQLLTNFTTI